MPNHKEKAMFIRKVCGMILRAKYFSMRHWTTEAEKDIEQPHLPGSCGTGPSCIAGFIEAADRKRAKELFESGGDYSTTVYRDGVPQEVPNHGVIAAQIWQERTGLPCRLDFHELARHNKYTKTGRERKATAREAVDHILNVNPDWPQV